MLTCVLWILGITVLIGYYLMHNCGYVENTLVNKAKFSEPLFELSIPAYMSNILDY